jgi:ectoine hydroxylase
LKLTPEQVERFERDGFLVFPGLIAADEIALLQEELTRAGRADDARVVRERSGGVRMVYGLHEQDGPTASRAYQALVRTPRLLQPMQDLLGPVFVYHTKANTKAALEGAIYEWHQDYANWQIMDGTPDARIHTSMLLLDEATEIGGCLYVIPGSHRLGVVPPDVAPEQVQAAIDRVVTQGEPMSVPNSRMAEIVASCGEPVALTGKPGTVVIFHGNLIHGSGHNMSVHSRWILYTVYSAIDNRPGAVKIPRADYKASRTAGPARLLPEGSLRESMQALG